MRKVYKKAFVLVTCAVMVVVTAAMNLNNKSNADTIKRTCDYNLNINHEVSVLSQNLRLTAIDEFFTNNSILLRLGRVEELCNRYDADIKCFQECDFTWRTKLGRLFPKDEYFVCYQKNSNGLANPIYVKKSKFDILDSGNILLNDVYTYNGKEYESRIATWVKVKAKDTGDTLTMINTHIAFHEDIQVSSCKKIKEFAQNAGTDGYLICGDFNFAMDKISRYEIMSKNGSKDMAYAALNEGITGVMSSTCHGFGNAKSYSRIDFFFGSDSLTSKMYTVVNDMFDNGFASDHFGILTYIDINK